MQIRGLEGRRADVAHGMMVVRFAQALTPEQLTSAYGALAAAHLVPALEAGEAAFTAPSRFLATEWLVPEDASVGTARDAVVGLEQTHGAESAWFYQTSTEVEDEGEDEEEDDDDEDEDEEEDEESRWVNGPPERAEQVAFALERYPEILEEFDWEDFGIALKLGGSRAEGEQTVLDAFHAFWMAPYKGKFRHARATFDPKHRAALLWVDRFAPPASTDEMVHHLLWIANQLHEIVPVVHARFDQATMQMKYAALQGDTTPPFVLAGNPLAEKVEKDGENAAAAWAESQDIWGPRELAAMWVELGKRNDPDEPDEAPGALRMFDRARAIDPTNDEAAACAARVLAGQGRVEEAIARAQKSGSARLRIQTLDFIAVHAAAELPRAAFLADHESLAQMNSEGLGGLVVQLGEHAPEELERLLGALPERDDLPAHLYNACFKIKDEAARMKVLDRTMALPPPAPDAGPQRQAYTMAFNNACVLAHAKKDFRRAKEIADRAQPYAEENPYIYHAAACAYAAVGDLKTALEQVKGAVQKGYDHLDKLEKDTDLGELLGWPEFKQLFAAWHAEEAKSEGVIEAHEANFELTVLKHDRPVLVDFTASWCGPCQRLAPIVERIAKESRGRYRVAKLDIDANQELSHAFNVRSVPTLIVFVNGEAKGRHTGLTDKATLMKFLETAGGVGADVPAPSGPPARPASVPQEAEWIEKDKEWELVAKDGEGKKHGPIRWWRKDGTMCCEAVFEHGVETGPYTRYHENGEKSQWGQMKNDKRFGLCAWQRSTGPTTENTIPPQLSKNIWRSEQDFADDGSMTLCRFYDKDGREIDMHGNALEARPEGLPPFAERFQASKESPPRWEDGRRRANGDRFGLWRYWDAQGKLVEEIRYDDDLRQRRAYGADGKVTIEGGYVPEEGRFPGGGRSPGRPTGTWRFFDADGKVVAEGDLTRHALGSADDDEILAFLRAPRPAGVPQDARFDARAERWALGETGEGERRVGTWSFWSKEGRLEERLAFDAEGKSVHQMLFYENGKPRIEGSCDLDDDGDPDDKIGTWRVFSLEGSVVGEIDVDKEPWKSVASYSAQALGDLVRMTKLAPSPIAEEAQKVPWTKLSDPERENRYCWGDIRHHVPVLVNALVRGDAGLRETAFDLLFAETFHQGSIYEASARLTPFFIRLAGDPTATKEERERYFGALRCYAESLGQYLPQVDPHAPAAKWLGFMRDAFVRARSQLVAWARTGDADTRDRATMLLTIGVFGDEILPELFTLLRAEKDPTRRAQIALGLAKVARTPDARARVNAALGEEQQPIVRFALALALVESAEDEPPQAAVDLLLELVERPPAGFDQAYAKLPGAEGPIGANVGATLANAIASVEQRLGVAARLVPAIAAHLAQETTVDAFYDVATLLKLTQPRDAEEAEFDAMRHLRVRALEAICAMKDELWTWVNFREVLDDYGVPTAWTAEEGRAKLRELASSEMPYAISSDDDEDDEDDDEE